MQCLPCAAHALLTVLASVYHTLATRSNLLYDRIFLTNRRHKDRARDSRAQCSVAEVASERGHVVTPRLTVALAGMHEPVE